MKYEEFVGQVTEEIKARMPGREIKVRKMTKNNGVVHDGMTIHEGGEYISPVICLDGFFESGKSAGEAADMIASEYGETGAPQIGSLSWLLDFGKVKSRIIYRIINRDRNKALLEEVPHKDFAVDLAIVFACVVWAGDGQDGVMLVRNRHMEMWNTDAEKLFALAEENTPRMRGWSMKSIGEVLAEAGGCGTEMPLTEEEAAVSMYVLTNRNKLHGAACILYPGLLDKIGERLEDDYYVLPSSLHEMILVPSGMSGPPEALSEIIQSVNRAQVPEEEILSDHPYFYSRERGELIAA